MLVSCQVDRRLSEGRFQKRKHTGGWHVDLHRGGGHHIGSTKPKVIRTPLVCSAPSAPVLREVTAEEGVAPVFGTVVAANDRVHAHGVRITSNSYQQVQRVLSAPPPAQASVDVASDDPVTDETNVQALALSQGSEPDERRQMEPLALFGFMAFLAGFAMALAALLPVAFALWVIALGLSIAALVRIQTKGTRGKGFAIATILLLVGMVVTMIIVVQSMRFSSI